MSAYMVSNDTLDLLATVSIWDRYGMIVVCQKDTVIPAQFRTVEDGNIKIVNIRKEDANLVKSVLFNQNVRSLVARYNDDPKNYSIERFNYVEATRNEEHFKKVFGAIRCYEYQACETNDYYSTFARCLLQAIAKEAMSEFSEGHWEYNRKSIVTV